MLNHLNELSNNNISNYPVVNNGMFQNQRRLGSKGDYQERELFSIIVTQKGESDYLAIDLYTHIRAWFKPKKNGDLKLKEKGYKTSYEELAKKFKCSKYKVKRRIVALENLGLIARDFRIEYMCGQRLNNVLYILVWKETPHFYNEFGIERTVAFPANLDKKTWENIRKKDSDIFIQNTNTPPIKTARVLEQECIGPRAHMHTSYNSNTTPNTTPNTNLNNFVIFNIAKQEEDVDCLNSSEEHSNFDNSDNKQKTKNEFELTKEKQVELLQSLSGNATPPPAITNLMKSGIYKAPETYTWDYEQYRKDHGLDKIKEETAVTIVSKGMEMLKNLKVIKQEEVTTPPATSAEFAHVEQLSTNEPITNRGFLGQSSPQEFDKPVLSINANGRFEPNSEFKPNFLRNYRFNRQQFDEIRILTNDLELTDDEIIGTIQGIVTDKPDTQIWGGKKAFCNFMVKVLNNRRKATLEDDSESIADIERKKYEKALYNFENKIIEWF